MSDAARPTVPRALRVLSFLLASLLTLLFIWLLGFVIDDVDDLEGPDRRAIERELLDPSLLEEQEQLAIRLAELRARITREQQIQGDLRDAMDNARTTMQQMMDLHQLALEQGQPPTDEDKQTLAVAQQRFLESQDAYAEANARITAAREQVFAAEQEQDILEERLRVAREPVNEAYSEQRAEHRFHVAAVKLVVIVPLFLLSALAFARHKGSAYRSILFAALAATFWKLGHVMFDVFPREFFKYIAITAAIAIVLSFLAWLLRKAARPDAALLVRRYREAYRQHVCPVCTHPIARGPLRFAVWTRKGPRLAAGVELGDDDGQSAPYTCPSCGTTLFETCGSCGGSRHSLLPYCEHCGAEGGAAPAAG